MHFMKIKIKTRLNFFCALALVGCAIFEGGIQKADAAVLKLNPNSGKIIAGDTFGISLYLDTEGQEVNAVQAVLNFTPGKLQVVSPDSGNSILGIWPSPIKYDNQKGTVEFTGGIPNGLKTNSGLIYALTFKAETAGTAVVGFSGASQVFLNDGKGTKIKPRLENGIFDISVLAPMGLLVFSDTHPDQEKWYREKTAIVKWTDEGEADGYSYMLDENPTSIPDDVMDEQKSSVIYENLSDNKHYFHIKKRQDEAWGGATTHFSINVDATIPSNFRIEIFSDASIAESNPIFRFYTTDNLSGVDHYEMKIIPLQHQGSVSAAEISDNQPIFSEVTSPFVAEQLPPDNYDVIVRAYDEAGNFSDSNSRIKIGNQDYRLISGNGVAIGHFFISWVVVIFFGLILCIALAYAAHKIKERYDYISHEKRQDKVLEELEKQMREFKKFKERYSHLAMLLIFLAMTLFCRSSVALAAGGGLEAPVVTNILSEAFNNEIFYAGGKTDAPEAEIILYLKNLETGEVFIRNTFSDEKRDWFYRHDSILPNGEYVFWVKNKEGEEAGSASYQTRVTIKRTVLRIGSFNFNQQDFYLVALSVLFVLLSTLLIFIVSRRLSLYKKEKEAKKEVIDMKEAVRLEFRMLQDVLEKKLALIERRGQKRIFSESEKEIKRGLISDLDEIKKNTEKDVTDVQKYI